MRSKVVIVTFSGIILLSVLSAACLSGFLLGQGVALIPKDLFKVPLDQAEETFPQVFPFNKSQTDEIHPPGGTPDDLEERFAPFWEAWEIVHDEFVDQPLDDEALVRGAIRGMVEALDDQHTSYLDPDQYFQSTIPLSGEYEGIGAWVDPKGEYLTIVSPMPDSPAEKAGLKPGDQIIAVDGEDMTGIDGSLVIRRVMGPEGTKVLLSVLRENEPEILEFEVERANIVLPSLESEMLAEHIAYIRLFQFGDNSARDQKKALRELLKEKPVGLILDLRDNGGGFLHSAIDITSEYISEGVIAYEQYGDGRQESLRASRGGLATEIPLVILINEGSASASEILAGAIQDYDRGILVGMTSFGKGSVQTIKRLSNDNGAIRVTTARWLTPDERLIHEQGLVPDILIPITEEDITADRDPQLDAAIEVLLDGS